MARADLSKYIALIGNLNTMRLCGKVTQVIGMVIESHGPSVSIGDLCYVHRPKSQELVSAEAVGFRQDKVLLMAFGEMRGISAGAPVVSSGKPLCVNVGDNLLGRIVDGLGNPQDGKGPLFCPERYSVNNATPNPLLRRRVTERLDTGVRAIDALLTCGKGQRLGIFAGSGVGKSTLLGMISRYCNADVVVVGLIGERGREVRDFVEENLGANGLRRAVVVAATSDQPPLVRINGALIATSCAEYFRDKGKNVLLVMDSVTRLAMAQREVGLAIGEPPTTKGYTPSVFSLLPRLMERSGNSERGSITAFYTVLVESDDMNEPVADTCRSILDGHIVLSRELSDRGQYPPIDVLRSTSRLMSEIADRQHLQAASEARDILASYKTAEDMINIGAYQDGSNPRIDRAKRVIGKLNGYLRQDAREKTAFDEAVRQLCAITGEKDHAPVRQRETIPAVGGVR